jgi:hypothetical protein
MRTVIGGGLLGLALLLGVATAAHAADKRIVNLNLFTQQDLRAMAMGNAFGPVARGEGALFYNPAGLAQFDLDLKAEASLAVQGKSLQFAEDTAALTSSGGVSAGSSPSTEKYLKTYAGTTQRYNAQLLQSAVANLGYINLGFGVADLDSYRVKLDFTGMSSDGLLATDDAQLNDTLSAAEDRLRQQTAGLAFKLGKGKVLLGVATKTFRYSEKSASFAPTVQDILSKNLPFHFAGENFPSTTTYDLGMLYRVEFWSALKPQWSLTAFNVGGATLKGVGTTVEVPASYNWGFAFGPDTGIVHWLVSVEVEDLTDALKFTDTGTGANKFLSCEDPARTQTCVNQPRSLTQRTHVGAEIGIIRTPTGNNLFSVRAGSNRGYATYGLELNLWYLRLLYTRASDNLGYQDHVDKFDFVGYQAGIALAW